ncbi:MAG: PadR family transcriptional regulator, partial [Acidimicrobiales bacterium]
GYDIAAALRSGAAIGDVWHLTRQLVYRALERLEALGLVEPRRTEASIAGPPRTVYGPTARGRTNLRDWLVMPVKHIRDVRNAFLLKLVITEQLGLDPDDLIRAQRGAFADLLDERAVEPPRTDHVAMWRHHSAAAVAAFLDALDKPS